MESVYSAVRTGLQIKQTSFRLYNVKLRLYLNHCDLKSRAWTRHVYEQITRSCDHGNEHLGSIKGSNF